MLILVYKITGELTPSIAKARLVAEIEVDKIPEDQIAFADEHDGDFIESHGRRTRTGGSLTTIIA
jgi:hypothetical protein